MDSFYAIKKLLPAFGQYYTVKNEDVTQPAVKVSSTSTAKQRKVKVRITGELKDKLSFFSLLMEKGSCLFFSLYIYSNANFPKGKRHLHIFQKVTEKCPAEQAIQSKPCRHEKKFASGQKGSYNL